MSHCLQCNPALAIKGCKVTCLKILGDALAQKSSHLACNFYLVSIMRVRRQAVDSECSGRRRYIVDLKQTCAQWRCDCVQRRANKRVRAPQSSDYLACHFASVVLFHLRKPPDTAIACLRESEPLAEPTVWRRRTDGLDCAQRRKDYNRAHLAYQPSISKTIEQTVWFRLFNGFSVGGKVYGTLQEMLK